MNIAIIGTGYVGLVSGACLAEKGHAVVCVDTEAAKVQSINAGASPFHEPGLDDLLRKHVGRSLKATADLRAAVQGADLSLIAVGTPFDGKTIDLTYIRTASRQIGESLRALKRRHTVVVKSTVVPGTTTGVVLPILEEASGLKAGRDFGVGMNPEFLTEGEAVSDFMEPDRIVIGGIDEASIAAQDALYAAFTGVPVIRTNPNTAEMIKYASNCLLANLISFSNELGNLCAAIGGTDVADVMRGVHASRYLTPLGSDGKPAPAPINSFLWAGCGFGGSCLPKDVAALHAHGQAAGVPMRMLDAILRINQDQPRLIRHMLTKHFPSLKGVPVAVLGLSFRQDTDDLRHTPAVPIVADLVEAGADVVAYDPAAMEGARRLFADQPVRFAPSLREAVRRARAIVLVTRWREFKEVPELVRELNPNAVVVDGRRMLDPASVAAYEGVGR
jgi:UDPglucose 6-dehydrogenase/GDP-mannose 6-dehydrogenase